MIKSKNKIWKVGTLQYTIGGLIWLCILLTGGDIPWQLKDRAVGPSATILIKETIGVSEFVFGLIMVSFPAFTNIFLIPIVSYLSDRHRGRLGRRIPYMLFTLPFIVLGIYGLGLTPTMGKWFHELYPNINQQHAMLIFFSISWIILDFGTSQSLFLFNALVNDVVPREFLGQFFAVFRMVSLGAGIFFNTVIIEHVKDNIMAVFLCTGTIYAIGILLLCFKVKEGEYPPVEDNNSDGNVFVRVMGAVGTYFRQSFSMSYYRWVLIAMTVAMLSFCPINIFSIQAATAINLSIKEYGQALAVSFIFSLITSYLWGYLADKFHPVRCTMGALVLYSITMLIGWIFIKDAKSFTIFYILHAIISGIFYTTSASLYSKIFPKSIFAQFASAGALIGAIANMFFGPFVGACIDMLNKNYQCIFLFGAILSIVSALLFIKVLVNFLKLGGDKNYIAPMPK